MDATNDINYQSSERLDSIQVLKVNSVDYLHLLCIMQKVEFETCIGLLFGKLHAVQNA